jgi:hypothetical protein
MNRRLQLEMVSLSIDKKMIQKPGLSLFRSSQLGLLPVTWVISLKINLGKALLGTAELLPIEFLGDQKGQFSGIFRNHSHSQ